MGLDPFTRTPSSTIWYVASANGRSFSYPEDLPCYLDYYSTEIAAAWKGLDSCWGTAVPPATCGFGRYNIQLLRIDGSGDWLCELAVDPDGDFMTHIKGQAPTAPLAIVRACLKAKIAEDVGPTRAERIADGELLPQDAERLAGQAEAREER